MTYLHPDKVVSIDRVMVKRKAKKSLTSRTGQRKSPIPTDGSLVQNLAAHIYATRQARG